jgi:hypothetical protein
MILSFFPFDQPLQTNRDIKLMGVGLCSCCNPGVTFDANISGAVVGDVIARFVGKVQELESGLETGVTGASPPTVTSMGSSFYLGGQVQGRRP